MAHLMLGVLGAFQATLTDGSTARFESDKTRALLAYLAVEADRPHRREVLLGLLWPDEPELTARHNLRQALYSLRQTIGDSAAKPPYLCVTRDEIQFNPASNFVLDVAQFNSHLAARESHAHSNSEACAVCAPRLRQAVDLYRGKFLQEFFLEDSAEFEEWALARREALHQRALDALTGLANYHEQYGDFSATRCYALRQLELDPWREQSHRQMMRVFALEGQYGAAIAQYETCRRVLAEELGVEPSGETRELNEQIRTGSWKSPAHGSSSIHAEHPISTRSVQFPTSDHQLPTHLTPFLGRERELAELGRLIADPACRCVTLVGPGGIGKTRLAIETASHMQKVFSDGVYFIPLAHINSTRFIVPAIADAIGFAFQGAGPADPKTQLFSYLKEKQILLLTDNLEHLLTEPGVEVLAELLANAPQVKLLVTSRESSGLPGEWVFEVPGLPIPEGGHAEASAQNTSVELFLQRARRAHVGFNATLDDYPAIIRICKLVEGMPLGIELAAAWVRTLACDEIARELERGMDFLSVSTRDLPARHRSMRAVFDQSWKLLSEEEQTVLLRLSVFRGGFRREAAEAVAAATLSALSTLVTKSLIRRSGAGRYDLHELIRQFAAGQFAERPEEQTATQARHGSYYLMLFSRADGRLRSAAQQEALAELTTEIDNFRAAWDWAVTQGNFALIEQTLRTFAMYYDTRGWYQEGLDYLGRAVNALETFHKHSLPDRTDQIALGHLLTTRALLAYRLAQHAQAQQMLERSLGILRPLNEQRVMVESITFLGAVMVLTGNYARAMELFGEGLEQATAVGDRWFAAMCLSLQVNLAIMIGKSENAHERMQSAVSDWRAIGDPRFTAFGLNILGQSALTLGRYDEARAALEESVALNISVGARWNLGHAYQGLGAVAQAQGEHQRAVDMFRKGVDTFAELGGRFYVGEGLAEMGRSVFALGNDTEAERVWSESLRIATEIHGTPVALDALVGLASLRAKKGDVQSALELLLTVLNHPASIQDTRHRAEQLRTELEAQLTTHKVEAIKTRGQGKKFEAIVDELLTQESGYRVLGAGGIERGESK